MGVGFETRYFRPAFRDLGPEEKERQIAGLWKEYEQTRQGIMSYDDHLYRIRSWSITLTGLLLAGYLGINLSGTGVLPGIFIAALTVVTFGFWSLDALNKSLQMVHIYNSRDIEQLLRNEAKVYCGPSSSLRFEKKQGNHFKPILKNLMEESLWPFYLPPLAAAVSIIAAKDFVDAQCWQVRCDFQPDAYVAAAGMSVVTGVILISLMARSHTFRNTFLSWWQSKKTKKFKAALRAHLGEFSDREYRELVLNREVEKNIGGLATDILYNHRIGPYKMNLYWENDHQCGIIFMNSPARQLNTEYLANRKRVCEDTFESVNVIPVKFETDRLRNFTLISAALSLAVLFPMAIFSFIISYWNTETHMPLQIWVGIVGTLVALGFVVNGLRHIRKGEGHMANAGRLHIVMAVLFVPVMWLIVLMQVR